jgi:hypothetical protein
MLCQKCNLPVYTGTVMDDGKRGISTRRKELIAQMMRSFNNYWLVNYQLKTNFEFTWEDYKYITTTEPALLRNTLLNEKMKSMALPKHPVIVEPFAGCGADTITFLYNMKPKRIYVCDRDDVRSSLLQNNVTNFEKVVNDKFGSMTQIMDYYVGESRGIFDNVARAGDDISLLYLDPPWKLNGIQGKGHDGEADAEQLVMFLIEQVFVPMQKSSLFPKLIVIKSRFGWEELSKVMDKLPKKRDGTAMYIQTDTILFTPFKHPVYFHTLQTTNCVLHQWKHSVDYDKIYKGHSSHDRNTGKHGDLDYMRTVLDDEAR